MHPRCPFGKIKPLATGQIYQPYVITLICKGFLGVWGEKCPALYLGQ
jgi:hypothetical protein